MINVLYVLKFNYNLLLIFALKKKDIEMPFKLNNITLIQNNTAVTTEILKKQMYYLESTSKQQALTNQNDLISLISYMMLLINEKSKQI